MTEPLIAPRFATMSATTLRRIADAADVGEVTRRAAEDALYTLDANTRPPGKVRAWALARAAWDAGTVDW